MKDLKDIGWYNFFIVGKSCKIKGQTIMQTNLGNELKKRFRISILETFFQNLKSSRFLNKMLGIQKLVAIKKKH